MCIGKNYADHIKEVDTWKSAPGISTPEAPEHMIIFTKAPQSVIGPGAAIKYPHGWSELVDYEAELAVIIGKPGHGIRKEDALDHIFGYTILNDVTAREVQKRHQQAGQLYCLLLHLIR
jgi:2-keto-4-pentenoate hydratase/2-oxohepta-3-ene-1,7-dioic acid hydratase in catechol pathway